jgi:hypothetical protein
MLTHSLSTDRERGTVMLHAAEALCYNHMKDQGLVFDATLDPTKEDLRYKIQ